MTVVYAWRGEFDNAEVNQLHAEASDHHFFDDDWRTQVGEDSLGWEFLGPKRVIHDALRS